MTMMKTKVVIKQSSYDMSYLTEEWKENTAECHWPEDFHLRGGQYRTGEFFIFAASTNSNDPDEIAKSSVYYGTGITLHVAEEEAYKRYLQDKKV